MILKQFSSVFENGLQKTFLLSRIILLTPKLLEKFMDQLQDVKQLTGNYLRRTLDLALETHNEIIKSSSIIAFTYYSYFAELPSVLGPELCSIVQENTLKIISELSKEAEEDTNGLLMETLNQIISCNVHENLSPEILQTEFNLVLSISSKDPANVQVTVEAQDCLEHLLEGMNTETYLHYVDICLPSFIHTIDASAINQYRYTPVLSLILEFLTIFMKKKPVDGFLPTSISDFSFKSLCNLLSLSTEDETLQLATDAFSYMVYNTEPSAMVPKLQDIINVLDRLLSINVSDTAAMNVGTLVVTLFSKFSNEIQPLIPTILRAAVGRLIQAQNISTQQNLVSLLCFLTCSDPKQVIDLLYNFDSDHSTFTKVMNKWFESFETIRGEKKIKENIVALSKLYFTGDERLGKLIVNGDLIPYDGDLIITRSMAKKMPDKYTQIPAFTKIVKLFTTELGFQNKQPDSKILLESDIKNVDTSNNKTSEEAAGDDDEWEDVDDVLDYEKLREFVDDEDPADFGENDSDEITGLDTLKETIPELLVEFFKDVAARDLNGFHNIYNTLSENEKRILTENLV